MNGKRKLMFSRRQYIAILTVAVGLIFVCVIIWGLMRGGAISGNAVESDSSMNVDSLNPHEILTPEGSASISADVCGEDITLAESDQGVIICESHIEDDHP